MILTNKNQKMEEQINLNSEQYHKAEELTDLISRYVNKYSIDHRYFNHAMDRKHRTLQQAFMGVVLNWILHVSDNDCDGRNIYSKETAKEIVDAMERLRGYEFKDIARCPMV
jgi:hypothetical protein